MTLGECLSPLNLACDELLMVAFCLLAIVQTVYVAGIMVKRDFNPIEPSFAYELVLVPHALVMAGLCLAHSYGTPTLTMDFLGLLLPMEQALWLNLPLSALAIMSALRSGEPSAVSSVVILLLWMPPVATALGHALPALVIADASLFLYRSVFKHNQLLREKETQLLRISTIEVLGELRTGVMCVSNKGRALYLNDAMRTLFSRLDMQGDLGDLTLVWGQLATSAGESPSCTSFTLHIPHDGRGEEDYLVEREELTIRSKRCQCVTAYNISEEVLLQKEIMRASQELERQSDKLMHSLRTVQDVAEVEARRAMRSRIHDVIGQRLSLLHRHLEDDNISDEAISHLRPLLTSILTDLRYEEASPEEALSAVIEAFRSVGVSYDVRGSLPAQKDIAAHFVRVIREASTNAVRHGQAHHLLVSMDQTERTARLLVENDGHPPQVPQASDLREGTGLRGMRAGAEQLGGRLSIGCQPQFSLHVEVPLSREPASPL